MVMTEDRYKQHQAALDAMLKQLFDAIPKSKRMMNGVAMTHVEMLSKGGLMAIHLLSQVWHLVRDGFGSDGSLAMQVEATLQRFQ